MRWHIPETFKMSTCREFVKQQSKMDLEQRQHYCPHCWKYVGAINVENHTAGSCEAIDKIDDDVDEDEDSVTLDS